MNEDPKAALEAEIKEIEAAMQVPDFWADKDKAQATIKHFQELKDKLEGVGKYDRGAAIMTIFAGAGGDDAEDFAAMLFSMYRKFCDRGGFTITPLQENSNDVGGYRNISFRIEGRDAYGILKNESGVHRLVRISPFNAKGKRNTSFALVEVIPKFDTIKEFEIPEQEVRVEFARSSGPGGQNVNKRETSVRLVHLPTGITVSCQSERTQEANRDEAWKMLQGKLYKRLEDEKQNAEQSLYISKTTDNEWGSQIRSYVLHPYKLVKDHRTEVETSNIEAVLEGDIQLFLDSEKNL